MRPTGAVADRQPVRQLLLGLLRRAGPPPGTLDAGRQGRRALAAVSRRRVMIGLALLDLGLAAALIGLAALVFR
jgi:hypothetical protein